MKFYLKHITLKKHATYTEDRKVFILNFSQSTKNLLKTSNIFTKDCIIHTCITLIKNYFGQNTEVKINYLNHAWSNCIKDEVNTTYFKFHLNHQENIRDKIDKLERYWINWGTYEKDPKKYGDLFQHLIPIEKQYTDINDIIKDMNKMFDEVYKNEK